MRGFLGFLAYVLYCAGLAGLVLATLVTLVRRLQAKSISLGLLPDELADKLRKRRLTDSARFILAPADEKLEASLLKEVPRARRRFFARAAAAARAMPEIHDMPLTMRDHMQIVDTHLLRAQEYVVALGADEVERGRELLPLFRKLRAARKVLRAVVNGGATTKDEPS